MMVRRTAKVFTIGAVAMVALACNDEGMEDDRGYTKAPLENPGWIVEPEEKTEMDRMADPILVPMLDTVDVDTATGASPDTTSAAGA